MSLTVHCLVRNEEKFVGYAIRSVVDYADQILVFDTGSTDKTVEKINELKREYPQKIVFEEKGLCDKLGHTKLREEMLRRTKTDWFMILDGDEIWTKRGMEEVVDVMKTDKTIGCLVAPFYLCAGDVLHHSNRGKYSYDGLKIHALARIFRVNEGIKWNIAPYGAGDFVKDDKGDMIRKGNYLILKNKYWHASALVRSSKDDDVNMGRHKQVITYSLKLVGEGLVIMESAPEVFGDVNRMRLPLYKSWVNLLLLGLFWLGFLKKRIWI
jgi:glycosyltransferase involved in cell wall biosynthesis